MNLLARRLLPEEAQKIYKRLMYNVELINIDTSYMQVEVDYKKLLDKTTEDMLQLMCHIEYVENILRQVTGERPDGSL